MPNDTNSAFQYVVVKTMLGAFTDDKQYQTPDGRWWRNWDGQVRTGQEVRELYHP